MPWKRIVLCVATLAIACWAYVRWGEANRARYEWMVAELRAAGEPTTAAGLLPSFPDADNGIDPLVEAAEIFHEASYSEPDGPDPSVLEPCLDKLRAALERPHLAPRDADGWSRLGDIRSLIEWRVALHPSALEDNIDLLLRVSDRWRQGDLLTFVGLVTVRLTALTWLRDAIADGRIRDARGGWIEMLDRAEAHDGLADYLRAERVTIIRFYESYIGGEDPRAAARRTRRETLEKLDELALDDTKRQFESMMPERPPPHWWTARWARPILYWKAVRNLNEINTAIAEMRPLTAIQQRIFRLRRREVAACRLARHALTRGAVPIDPATGDPFRTESVGGGTRAWSPVSDELRGETDPWPEPELFDWFLPNR